MKFFSERFSPWQLLLEKVTEEKQNYISELSPVSKGCKK